MFHKVDLDFKAQALASSFDSSHPGFFTFLGFITPAWLRFGSCELSLFVDVLLAIESVVVSAVFCERLACIVTQESKDCSLFQRVESFPSGRHNPSLFGAVLYAWHLEGVASFPQILNEAFVITTTLLFGLLPDGDSTGNPKTVCHFVCMSQRRVRQKIVESEVWGL